MSKEEFLTIILEFKAVSKLDCAEFIKFISGMVESFISILKNPDESILNFTLSLSAIKLPIISEFFNSINPFRSAKLLLKSSSFLISKAN